jgi:hypothetical protein
MLQLIEASTGGSVRGVIWMTLRFLRHHGFCALRPGRAATLTTEGRAQTSLQITSDLVRSFTDLRAHLSTIAPDPRLPATLFDLVDIAWSELMK